MLVKDAGERCWCSSSQPTGLLASDEICGMHDSRYSVSSPMRCPQGLLMGCMKRSRWLITVLVGVNLLGVLLAPLPALLLPGYAWGRSATFLLGFLAIGQVYVLAVWAALDGKPTAWRMVGIAVILVGWFALLRAIWY